jgi:hypothetical protein
VRIRKLSIGGQHDEFPEGGIHPHAAIGIVWSADLDAGCMSVGDQKTYLSLGADFRERFEANNAAAFGISPNRNNDWLISRTEVHADLRIADQVHQDCRVDVAGDDQWSDDKYDNCHDGVGQWRRSWCWN